PKGAARDHHRLRFWPRGFEPTHCLLQVRIIGPRHQHRASRARPPRSSYPRRRPQALFCDRGFCQLIGTTSEFYQPSELNRRLAEDLAAVKARANYDNHLLTIVGDSQTMVMPATNIVAEGLAPVTFTGRNGDFRHLVVRGALLELVTFGFYRF